MEQRLELVRAILSTPGMCRPPDGASPPTSFLDARGPQPECKLIGEELLRQGRVAVLMVAGGMSTRMGGDVLRGDLPVGPVTGKSILQLQGEKVSSLRQRYATRMPWLVMTSAQVHDAVIRSFQRANFFGVPTQDVWFLQQASLPIVDVQFNPVRLADGAYLESPTGHGGMLEALNESNLLRRLEAEGIEYLFYFQFPNVLERVGDPVMLGYHYMSSSEVTTKAIYDYEWLEKLGRCVEVGGKLQIVEYHLLRNVPADSWWHCVPANVGTHVWNVSFLARCAAEDVQLPYHKVPHHSTAGQHKLLQKAEQFVFDLLPYAKSTGMVIVLRDEEYASVKSSSGKDSLEAARMALCRLYRSWLNQADAVLEGGEEAICRVEISPLFALCAEELRKKLPLGFRYRDGFVFQ